MDKRGKGYRKIRVVSRKTQPKLRTVLIVVAMILCYLTGKHFKDEHSLPG
jgi:hypothetical protein